MRFNKKFLIQVAVMLMAFAVCAVYNVNFSQTARAQESTEEVEKKEVKAGEKKPEKDPEKTDAKKEEKKETDKGEAKEGGASKKDDVKKEVSEKSVPKVEKKDSWDKADKWIGRVTDLLSGLFYLVLMVLGWVGKNEWLKNKRLQKILGYADDVFEYIEKAAKKTDWKGDDKLVKFLEKINDMLKVDGDKPLDTDEVERLKIEAEKKAEKSKDSAEKKEDKVSTEKKEDNG